MGETFGDKVLDGAMQRVDHADTLQQKGVAPRSDLIGLNTAGPAVLGTAVLDGLGTAVLDIEGLDIEGLDIEGLDIEGLDIEGLDTEVLDTVGVPSKGIYKVLPNTNKVPSTTPIYRPDVGAVAVVLDVAFASRLLLRVKSQRR